MAISPTAAVIPGGTSVPSGALSTITVGGSGAATPASPAAPISNTGGAGGAVAGVLTIGGDFTIGPFLATGNGATGTQIIGGGAGSLGLGGSGGMGLSIVGGSAGSLGVNANGATSMSIAGGGEGSLGVNVNGGVGMSIAGGSEGSLGTISGPVGTSVVGGSSLGFGLSSPSLTTSIIGGGGGSLGLMSGGMSVSSTGGQSQSIFGSNGSGTGDLLIGGLPAGQLTNAMIDAQLGLGATATGTAGSDLSIGGSVYGGGGQAATPIAAGASNLVNTGTAGDVVPNTMVRIGADGQLEYVDNNGSVVARAANAQATTVTMANGSQGHITPVVSNGKTTYTVRATAPAAAASAPAAGGSTSEPAASAAAPAASPTAAHSPAATPTATPTPATTPATTPAATPTATHTTTPTPAATPTATHTTTPAPAPAPTTKSYTIARGDTLTSIAKKFSTTVTALASLNNIKNVNLIITGNKLQIPT